LVYDNNQLLRYAIQARISGKGQKRLLLAPCASFLMMAGLAAGLSKQPKAFILSARPRNRGRWFIFANAFQ